MPVALADALDHRPLQRRHRERDQLHAAPDAFDGAGHTFRIAVEQETIIGRGIVDRDASDSHLVPRVNQLSEHDRLRCSSTGDSQMGAAGSGPRVAAG